jgi:hypothetical protein
MRVALGPAGASYVAVAEECSMWQSQSTEAASGIRGAQAGGCTRGGVGEKGEKGRSWPTRRERTDRVCCDSQLPPMCERGGTAKKLN